ncbi:MAG TPA: hypothetical protein VGJ62_13960 [Gemmatimonadaceae bacterium]|jgi:hypothetical protein
MPRAYTIATAALALGTSPKWLDNTLSHFGIAGVVQQKQGVARRITIEGLLTLSVTLALIAGLGSPLGASLDIAQKMIASDGVYDFTNGLRLELDLRDFRDRLLTSLERAVEIAPLPRRGRPPKNTTGRLK